VVDGRWWARRGGRVVERGKDCERWRNVLVQGVHRDDGACVWICVSRTRHLIGWACAVALCLADALCVEFHNVRCWKCSREAGLMEVLRGHLVNGLE
jgi:hypothetical protein